MCHHGACAGVAQSRRCNVLAPILNALLARSVEPEAEICGYALALSVMMVVALPQARVQALTLVLLLDNQDSLQRLWTFVGSGDVCCDLWSGLQSWWL